MSRYIIKLKDETPDALITMISEALNELGLDIIHEFSTVFKGFSIFASMSELPIQQLSSIPFIDYIERDFPWTTEQVQSPTSWGLDRIDQASNNLDGNYVFDATGKNVNVYVLDSAVELSHSEFDGRARSVFTAKSLTEPKSDKCFSTSFWFGFV